MRQLEDFMNSLTDKNWGWWPVVRFRPAKDSDIDNKVLLQMSPIFGSMMGLAAYFLFLVGQRETFSAVSLIGYVLVGWVVFFVLYKLTFAYFWNNRARRLRRAEKHDEPVAS